MPPSSPAGSPRRRPRLSARLGAPAASPDPLVSPVTAHLLSLVSKSLLLRPGTAVPSGAGRELEEGRFGFLETIREYALECLEEWHDALASARSRHARYFLRLVEEMRPRLSSNEQAALMSELGRELGNLRAALTWSFEATPLDQDGDSSPDARTGTGIRMVAALWRFWLVQGLMSEGRNWMSRALLAYGIEQEVEQGPEGWRGALAAVSCAGA